MLSGPSAQPSGPARCRCPLSCGGRAAFPRPYLSSSAPPVCFAPLLSKSRRLRQHVLNAAPAGRRRAPRRPSFNAVVITHPSSAPQVLSSRAPKELRCVGPALLKFRPSMKQTPLLYEATYLCTEPCKWSCDPLMMREDHRHKGDARAKRSRGGGCTHLDDCDFETCGLYAIAHAHNLFDTIHQSRLGVQKYFIALDREPGALIYRPRQNLVPAPRLWCSCLGHANCRTI